MNRVKQRSTFILIIIAISLMLSSCVPSSGSKSRKSTSSGVESPSDDLATPEPQAQDYNYIFHGASSYTSTFTATKDFSDTFMLRGNAINSYLNDTVYSDTSLCLVTRFSTALPGSKVLVLAAIPEFFHNYSTGAKEYYYRVRADDPNVTQSICQTANMLVAMSTLYPTDSVVFDFNDICPTCSNLLSSTSLQLYSTGGTKNNLVSISNLHLNIYGSSTTPTTLSCGGSTDCTSQNYDCCIDGQCVNNGTVKNGVDTSSVEYLEALQYIIQNPSLYSNYPDLFYICPVGTTPPTPTPTATIDPVIISQELITRLGELYACVTTGANELAICTKEYADASTTIGSSGATFAAGVDDKNFITFNASMPINSITEIVYAGDTLYKTDPTNYSLVTKELDKDLSRLTIPSNIAEVSTFTSPPSASLDGKYFSLHSTNGSYFVWYTLDSSATPAPAGVGTPINVQIYSYDSAIDVASRTSSTINAVSDFIASSSGTTVTITNSAIGAGDVTDLSDNTAGISSVTTVTEGDDLHEKSFIITGGSGNYVVWFNVSGGSAPGGGTPIQVDILNTDSALTIAIKTAAAINTQLDFSASSSANTVTISNLTSAIVTNITDGTSGIYDILSLVQANGPFSADNDDLTSGQEVLIRTQPPVDAPNDILKVKYQIDGSCDRVNSMMVRCTKYYVHGQEDLANPRVDDHPAASTTYSLPSYANTTYQIVVTVDETIIAEDSSLPYSTWHLNGTDVIFDKTVYSGQKLKISYYVITVANQLMYSKELAQTEIKSYCNCTDLNCSLSPVSKLIDGVDTIVEYECIYPTPPTPDPPLQQEVYVDTKSTPHRFYATDGGVHDDDHSGYTQEGTLFEYEDNDLLKPNNQSGYLGFNEILGSYSNDLLGSQSAYKVDIIKNRIYDVFTDIGSFSTCTTCGNDYYTSIQRIFPQHNLKPGGGYTPDLVETSKMNNLSAFRADDMIFGRACFLPPTMIPWTHATNSDLQTQRMNRLQAQHFLFANGYQRDWYGFDYGALIGSFDGVTWFAIGSQRRVTAKTGKLFLAINAYFGDQTVKNNFTVTVSEVVSLIGGSTVEHDTESDGAQCQAAHYCSTDQDCVTQLGWEYSCQTVSGIQTSWPVFGSNADEIANNQQVSTLSGLVGGTNGQSRRCVYRGRGAPCHQLYTSSTADNSYTKTTTKGLHSCSSNSYCELLTTSGKFNNRISRYAKTPVNQNASANVLTQTDTFGIGARILGRPFEYNGTSDADVDSTGQLPTQLATNFVDAICIPGKKTNHIVTDTLEDLGNTTPGVNDSGDKVNNIGLTATSALDSFYSNCAVLDESGSYYRNQTSPIFSPAIYSLDEIKEVAATQNISSYLIELLDPFNDLEIMADYDTNGLMVASGIQENSCLRNAGSPCHTDLDCAPSKFAANKLAGLTISDVSISEAELKFWQEGLICGQKIEKSNPDYKLKDNLCCRETGSELTIYSDESNDSYEGGTKDVDTANIAGLVTNGTSLSATTRYSRIAPAYSKMQSSASDYPPLQTYKIDPTVATANGIADNQYNTFHEIASKTCCSRNWVRNFHSSNGGGGHEWREKRLQDTNKSIFKCINWADITTGTQAVAFECTPQEADGIDCKAKTLITSEQDNYLTFFGALELAGIPQIKIPDEAKVYCEVDSADQTGVVVGAVAIPETITAGATVEYTDGTPESFYAANDTANFESDIIQIFDSEKVSCCLPTGEYHGTNLTSDQCCTNFATAAHPGYCCLKDFTDVTVYLNRYVSSEAAHLSSSAFDPETGYINNAGLALQVATQKGMCCSGKAIVGRAISSLQIPGTIAAEHKTTRFVTSNSPANNMASDGYPATTFDYGVKWNNHVYCVPDGYPDIQ